MGKILKFEKKSHYQIKISLNGIRPPIWRRLIVDSSILLPDLHDVIQSAMGWFNGHLHQFRVGRDFFSGPMEDDGMGGMFGMEGTHDYRDVRLRDVLVTDKQKIYYEYDFGDGWDHTVLLEKQIDDYEGPAPVCIKGKRACPPEDCGGPGGYMHMLQVLEDPEDDEYEDYIDWVGDDFDPEELDIDGINIQLGAKK